MDESTAARIRATDWLKHRWNFEIGRRSMQGQTKYEVRVGPLVLSSHSNADAARRAIDLIRIVNIAEAVRLNPEFAGGTVFIEGGGGPSPRLARIPRRLWPTYDAIVLGRMSSQLSMLSAKARALFADDPSVFVRARIAPDP